jgi:tRNA(fMet)-specific endonuclease VapC
MTDRLWMLDSDVCIEMIRGHRPELRRYLDRLTREGVGNRIVISAIVYAELDYGRVRRLARGQRQPNAEDFLKTFEAIPWDAQAAAEYARIRVRLETAGQLIGVEDMMIAAHAITTGAILVTNNTSHFARLSPPLHLENWIAPDSGE